jgi:hypothetical protein
MPSLVARKSQATPALELVMPQPERQISAAAPQVLPVPHSASTLQAEFGKLLQTSVGHSLSLAQPWVVVVLHVPIVHSSMPGQSVSLVHASPPPPVHVPTLQVWLAHWGLAGDAQLAGATFGLSQGSKVLQIELQ